MKPSLSARRIDDGGWGKNITGIHRSETIGAYSLDKRSYSWPLSSSEFYVRGFLLGGSKSGSDRFQGAFLPLAEENIARLNSIQRFLLTPDFGS